MTTMITIPQAAEKLTLSTATVYCLIQARDYKARIQRGEIAVEDVPRPLRNYLDAEFPAAIVLTERNIRLDANAVEEWARRPT